MKILETDDGLKLHNYYPLVFKFVISALLGLAVWLLVIDDSSVIIRSVLIAIIFLAWVGFMSARAYLATGDGEFRYGISPLVNRRYPVAEVVDVRAIVIAKEHRIAREWGAKGKETAPEGYLVDCGSSTRAVQVQLTGGRKICLGWGHDDEEVQEAANRLYADLRSRGSLEQAGGLDPGSHV